MSECQVPPVVSSSARPHGQLPTRLLCPWDSPGKNTGVGCHALLQGIFLTQGSNAGCLHWQADCLPLSHQASPPGLVGVISEVKVAQSCLTLCDPRDCSPPGSSVHEISQARILEWVAIPSSRGSSRLRDRTQVSRIAGRFFTSELSATCPTTSQNPSR